MTPLEKQAEHYAHNHFEMHENHFKGLKQGFIAGVESDYAKLDKLQTVVTFLKNPVFQDPDLRDMHIKVLEKQIEELVDIIKI